MFVSGVAHVVNHLHILAMFNSQKMVSMINNNFYLLDIFEQVPCHFLWFKSMSWSMLEMHSFVQASQPPLTILSVKYRHQVKDFWHWVGKGLDNLLDYFIRPWLHKTGMNSVVQCKTSVRCWYWCSLWFTWNWSKKLIISEWSDLVHGSNWQS